MSARRLAALLPRCCEELPTARCAALGASAVRELASTSSCAGDQLPRRPTHHRHSGALPGPFLLLRRVHDHAEERQHEPHSHDHHDHHHPHDHQQQTPSPPQRPASPRRPAPLSLKELEKACWSCDKHVKRGGLVCNGCETVQPPDESLNYFELFSLPVGGFDLPPQLLERRYKALQWSLHPDRLGHKPRREQGFSASIASTVNLAYSVLKAPLSRANYILMLRGIDSGDSHEGTIDDPELLMQVLEAREEVEETDDPAVLSSLLGTNRQQQEGLVAELSAAFRAGDLAAAVQLTHKLQYVARLEQEIVRKLPQL